MRIGTRGSALALAQARLVAGLLADAHPDAGEPELVVVRTSGDTQIERANRTSGDTQIERANERQRNDGGIAQAQAGDKSRWVAELEQALLAGSIDLAVHSAKDLPGEPLDGLRLLGAPLRASAEDALIGARSLEQLPEGAHVGTSSVRRAAQLRAARADLQIVSLRGNVNTRLRKLADQNATRGSATGTDTQMGANKPTGGSATGADTQMGANKQTGDSGRTGERYAHEPEPPLHAIVLASAGLRRLGRENDIGCTLDTTRFVPAPGQGLLALQAREGDERARADVEPILDPDASACLTAERAVAHALQASCNTPLGAHATPAGCGCLHLRAWVGLPDGSAWLLDELLGGFYDPDELGRRMAERLESAGGRALLRQAQEMAVEHH